MGRHSESGIPREFVVAVRMTREERKQFDLQRWKRGNLSRGQYVRVLLREDGERIKGNDV